MKPHGFTIKTLGCKVNQYEEQVMRENLLRFGFRETGLRDADVFIVNSCTVTGEADRKTRQLARRAKKENSRVKVFLTGCYAVLEDDIRALRSLPEVDSVVPLRDKDRLPLVLNSLFNAAEDSRRIKNQISGFGARTRAFLKVQDGCDQNCAYCKVRLVRGRPWYRKEQDILDEVVRLARRGYREIVLTGICLGSWRGGAGKEIAELLKQINRLEENFRIRLSSIEPNHISKRLIETISVSDKICKHLHIPLQSGSDRILRAMNRKYTTAQFHGLIQRIRKAIPLAGLTMDIIAGFPDEKEDDFERTLRFVRDIRPSRLHVFKYSDRKGTHAFGMKNKVPLTAAQDRSNRLIKEGKAFQTEFCGKFIGKEVDVLVERLSRGAFREGYTGEYVKVRVEAPEIPAGDILRIKINDLDKKASCLIA